MFREFPGAVSFQIVPHYRSDSRIGDMMRSVFTNLSRLSRLSDSRSLLRQQKFGFHRIPQGTRTVPQIISDATSVDEFQYFSMKIKDLMDKEQLEYFENVIKKVENINHPIAELMNAKLHNPVLDLIMMLITEMLNGDLSDKKILQQQRDLSNAIQLIHIGNLVHRKGIFDLSNFPNFGNSLPSNHDLILGNKIALLAGDFLLANAQMKITQMRIDEALKIISSALCDIVDSSFIGDHDTNDNPLPFKPGCIPKMAIKSFDKSLEPIKLEGTSGTAEDEWMFRQIMHRGSLIAKGCRISALLAKQTFEVQKHSSELGKYFYLTWQAFADLEPFRRENASKDLEISLISAPVLFHINSDPTSYQAIKDESKSLDGINHFKLYTKVSNGPGIEKTEKLLAKLKAQTLHQLKSFPDSEKRQKIESLLNDF